MSARNFLSAGEKNVNKLLDSLPNIKKHKFGHRSGQELPALSANTGSLLNRNINYNFEPIQNCFSSSIERAGTPFSDFFSESETGTPDFRSEESDSSAGSVLCRNTAEATKILAQEWEEIERTLYDEDGPKTTRPQMIEECQQWRQIHPQLRVIGKAIQLPEKRLSYKLMEHDEVIAMHYIDYEQFSESEDRLSVSSADVTPQNSPRISIAEDIHEPRLSREKISFYPTYELESDLSESFCSLLHITPIHIHTPLHRKKHSSSIMRSEMASSKWIRNRPESSVNTERNSAKSYISLDLKNYGNITSPFERTHILTNRVVTAKHREIKKLEPMFTPNGSKLNGVSTSINVRKVSLPPLHLEDDKKKLSSVSSAKKYYKTKKNTSKLYLHLDRVKHC